MGTYNYKIFKCFNLKFTVSEPGPPEDVKYVFYKFSSGADHLSADQLVKFLVKHQCESDSTSSDSTQIVEKILQLRKQNEEIEATEATSSVEGMSLDEFFHFLLLDDFNAPLKSQVHHDMNAPLSHYFIYTGHNSYLTGNQLSSDCSDVPIIKSLLDGVRVIELDLWPNSTRDDVIVVHGRTLTSPVALIQCLKSIKEHAFVKSHYPLIITLEAHLPTDLQAKVAEMVSQIFGEALYYPETDGIAEFPSPESLKDRILISTKPPKEYLESECSSPTGQMDEPETDSKNESHEEVEDLNASEEKSLQQCAPEYGRLITIHAGKPKGQAKDYLSIVGDVRRLSMCEQMLQKTCASHGTEIIRFTQKNILRVYPKGTRVSSSNYRPHIGWNYGAQMVAFNMQGYGRSLWFMQGMFRANGGCGYVKKPELLLLRGPHGEVFDPTRTLPVKKILKVKVYLGTGWSSDFSQTHFDSFSPPDFYTKVCIVGVDNDKVKKKTKVVDDDWFPVWDEGFEFPLTVPELALLRIEVREYDRHETDDFGGQTCLPVSELRPGFRSVPLYDKKGSQLKSVRLFMHFQFVSS
ncbi:phosphoinositide phospholipase C 6-like [Prosopis cineraria]|uniref:phosphoinositide phospholipase C 6-like n=1 Tax=Prosopis cineraria TaxID=364024 RepID=UPI00240EE4D9|nr:phosphoinositide phospholipase C 6-like [Prosopis cineraria]